MAHIQEDRVKDTSTTTGTGNMTLSGTAPTGFRTFGSVMANNDTCFYCIDDGASGWEVGLGTYVSATPALARTTVLASSNGGAAVNFGAGTKNLFITQPADRLWAPLVTTEPPGPASGVLLYSKALAGRHVPKFIGPSGLDSSLQPCLWGNTVVMWLPGTGTTASINFGVSWTVGATQAHPTIADTNFMTSIKRATYTTSTTAGNGSGMRSAAPIVIRNDGFFAVFRGGILTYTSTMRIWFGLSALSTALGGTDPSAQNDSAAFSKDSGETVWQAMTRDTSAASKTSTGETTVAAGANNVYDFYIYCKPGDSKLTFRMVDISDSSVIVDNVEKSSNLPTAATPLYVHAECSNQAGGAGSAVAIFLAKIYVETDN